MSSDNSERKYRGFTIQDFLVDGLGGLVPGTLFLLGVIVVVAPVSQAWSGAMSISLEEASFTKTLLSLLQAANNTPNMIWIGAFVCMLMLSYFLGLLFYRLDPKTPDRKSFARLAKGGLSDQSMKERQDWLRRNYGCDNELDCEFPYPYLRPYLEQRGHKHLLYLVPWDDNSSRRSKTHVNRLKIRLKYFCPEKCWPIVRNEAQVRLATSMWYVASVLRVTSLVGIVAVVAAIVVAQLHFLADPSFIENVWALTHWSFPFLLSPLVVLLVSVFCKSRVERFVHYQRLHEVFYLLELAHTAAKEHEKIIEDLPPDAEPRSAVASPVQTDRESRQRRTNNGKGKQPKRARRGD